MHHAIRQTQLDEPLVECRDEPEAEERLYPRKHHPRFLNGGARLLLR